MIVRHGSFLRLESEVLDNRKIAGLVILVVCCAKAYHACTLMILEGFLPTTKVVIEGLAREGLVRIFGIGPGGVGCWCAPWGWFAVSTYRSFPLVLVIVGTLLDGSL